MGIPLKTLSGGANYHVDFRECFERAMKARHLPTHESLLVINPKEIILSKIIGEGSFGRVWHGQWRNNSVAVKVRALSDPYLAPIWPPSRPYLGPYLAPI
jgi:hypothetical protein